MLEALILEDKVSTPEWKDQGEVFIAKDGSVSKASIESATLVASRRCKIQARLSLLFCISIQSSFQKMRA